MAKVDKKFMVCFTHHTEHCVHVIHSYESYEVIIISLAQEIGLLLF